MTALTKETVHKLAALCRIACSDEEAEALLKDLQSILSHVASLQEVDTEGVPPCDHVIAHMQNVFREDRIAPSLSKDTFLNNAPDQVDGMLRVPPILAQR